MANWSDPRSDSPAGMAGFGGATAARGAAYDAGLRKYMLSVYNYMASGVLLTGIVALLFANSGMAYSVFAGPGILKYIVMFAPLAFVMVLSFGINRLSTGAAQALYWAYAAVMGVSLSYIFLAYTGTSIAQTFFATAAAFAGEARGRDFAHHLLEEPHSSRKRLIDAGGKLPPIAAEEGAKLRKARVQEPELGHLVGVFSRIEIRAHLLA